MHIYKAYPPIMVRYTMWFTTGGWVYMYTRHILHHVAYHGWVGVHVYKAYPPIMVRYTIWLTMGGWVYKVYSPIMVRCTMCLL